MKPFDLEAAKRGEPIAAQINSVWCSDVKFVGVGYHDNVIIDTPQYGTLRVGNVAKLRMVPKKRTVWINLHLQRDTGDITPFLYEDEEFAKRQNTNSMNCLGTYPIEIEE